jgi:hypothetical protein
VVYLNIFIYIPLIPYSYGVEFYFILCIYTQSVRLLGRVIGPLQGLHLNTGQHKHRIKRTHTSNMHAQSGIRTHDRSVRASEDSSRLRPLGYRDRLYLNILFIIMPAFASGDWVKP